MFHVLVKETQDKARENDPEIILIYIRYEDRSEKPVVVQIYKNKEPKGLFYYKDWDECYHDLQEVQYPGFKVRDLTLERKVDFLFRHMFGL